MIDPIEAKLAVMLVDCRSKPGNICNGHDLAMTTEVLSELNQRIIELERKVRSQSAVIAELVGRANE